MSDGNIIIRGARENTLKNITVEIPRDKLVVITGLSGSGKSSLAFDTLYAEGQRRFAESLSSYARQFLGRMSKPDVDLIEGIPPAIAIEQKVNVRNPRSTVATTTEIYDFVRLVFARIGHTFSPVTGQEVRLDSNDSVVSEIMRLGDGLVYILSDLKWDSREDRVELMLSLKEQGYTRLFRPASGETLRIEDVMAKGENAPDGLMLMVDRMKFPQASASEDELKTRLWASVQDAFDRGNGYISVLYKSSEAAAASAASETVSIALPIGSTAAPAAPAGSAGSTAGAPLAEGYLRYDYSNRFEADGIVFTKPEEYLFSFNSPIGACPTCGGLGRVDGISEDLVVPDKSLSIYDSAIAPYRGDKMGWFKDLMCRNGHRYGLDVFKPYCRLSQKERDIVWKGVSAATEEDSIVGLNEFFKWVETQRYKIQFKYMLSRFSGRAVCPDCEGSRLRKEALWVKVGGCNIRQVLAMTVEEALKFWTSLQLSDYDKGVASKAIKEITDRLTCLQDVGLQYLTLDRASNTLSGGESQRINLVTALGSCLVGSLYILDEPSIGLHPRDTDRLIAVLKRLRDIGNTVVVVEHDEEIMRAADQIIDLGPGAGTEGGRVVYQGTVPCTEGDSFYQGTVPAEKPSSPVPAAEVAESSTPAPSLASVARDTTLAPQQTSLTLQYLSGATPRYTRSKRTPIYFVGAEGAQEHNLKDIDVKFPLGCLTSVTGVSGSGKSTLVGDILYPALRRHFEKAGPVPGTHRRINGNLDRINAVEYVDQSPIGKSSRSNAVTYLKIYDDIRKLLAEQQYAKINGYTPSFFSFNQEGGRCPECQGEGIIRIPMQFMSDVTMVCEACSGKRFKPDILQVRYREKNVDDILNMNVEEAIAFFGQDSSSTARRIVEKLQYIVDVGLGYIKLGQSSSTLSGGESQRIKLAYFLAMSCDEGRKHILFIFDEPTTGLHFKDVETLLRCFDQMLSRGHTVVTVEHNLDVMRASDWIIDLGPDAGDAGGSVVYAGTPEKMPTTTFTGKYLNSNII